MKTKEEVFHIIKQCVDDRRHVRIFFNNTEGNPNFLYRILGHTSGNGDDCLFLNENKGWANLRDISFIKSENKTITTEDFIPIHY